MSNRYICGNFDFGLDMEDMMKYFHAYINLAVLKNFVKLQVIKDLQINFFFFLGGGREMEHYQRQIYL